MCWTPWRLAVGVTVNPTMESSGTANVSPSEASLLSDESVPESSASSFLSVSSALSSSSGYFAFATSIPLTSNPLRGLPLASATDTPFVSMVTPLRAEFLSRRSVIEKFFDTA